MMSLHVKNVSHQFNFSANFKIRQKIFDIITLHFLTSFGMDVTIFCPVILIVIVKTTKSMLYIIMFEFELMKINSLIYKAK